MEWAVYRTIPFDVYVLKQLWILHDFLGNCCNLDWLMTVVFFFFFSARGFTRDAKVRWSALTEEWCWSCCDSWRKRYDAHTSVTGPGLHVSIIYQNLDVRMLYCRVSVRLLLRSSRSIHFGDVSEANRRETASLRPLDHVTRNALAAWQGALLVILSLGRRLGRCFVNVNCGTVLGTLSLIHWLWQSCGGIWVKIGSPKQSHSAIGYNIHPILKFLSLQVGG